MDFIDQIKALAMSIPTRLVHVQSEQATKSALIMPFIQALGYDVFNPTEVVPEYDANIGASTKYKLDYAILKDGKPIILIESKWHKDKLKDGWSQLNHYFVDTDARIGILTNGLIYKFYADLDKPNKMDETPFLELDMLNLKEPLVLELKRITKSALNIDEMLIAANELKYTRGIGEILTEQLISPNENFVQFFFKNLCPGRVFAGGVKQEFSDFTKRGLKQFIREQINSLLNASTLGEDISETPNTNEQALPKATEGTSPIEPIDNKVITTEEEIEGYYIVKSILREFVNPSRFIYKDTTGYFNVLLDNNKFKPICRFYFNNANKRIGLFDKGGGGAAEEKFQINDLNDIYQYADKLRATVLLYDQQKTA